MKKSLKSSNQNSITISKFQKVAITEMAQKNVKGGRDIVIEDIIEQ